MYARKTIKRIIHHNMNRYTPTMIWLLGCLLVCLMNWRCSSSGKPPIARVPTKITSYPLHDVKGDIHKYRDNFDSFIFPQDNKKLTQYCSFHFEWENIKAVWSKDKKGKWGYSYIVTKHKMSHKMRRR